MNKIKNLFKNKLLLVSLAIILLIAAGGGYWIYNKNNNPSSAEQPSVSEQKETLNLDPPTEDDKKSAEDNKQRIVEEQNRQNNENNDSSGKIQVTPVVTNAGQYESVVEVSSYVPGIFEDNGECVAKFSNGNESIEKKVTAVKEGSAVYCPLLSAATNEFNPKGTWKVHIEYTSPTAEGKSAEQNIEIR